MLVGSTACLGQSTKAARDAAYAQLRKESDLVDRQYVAKVVQLVQPSVVHIQANKTSRGSNNGLTKIEEAGAGVIMRSGDRYFVITNRHVIVDAENSDIHIQLENGKFFNPTGVVTDPDSDLAVLFVDHPNLIPARFGDSEEVRVGDFVIAFGSPSGVSE